MKAKMFLLKDIIALGLLKMTDLLGCKLLILFSYLVISTLHLVVLILLTLLSIITKVNLSYIY